MIETFEAYLTHNRGLSANTVKAYGDALRSFARHQKTVSPGTRWSTVTKSQIDDYVAYLVNAHLKPATIKQHISALRTFYKTIMAMGMMEKNPARYVSTPQLGQPLPKTIEREAILKALASTGTTPKAKAVIAIIYETGIRLGELLTMRKEDISKADHAIRVHGKGNKERTVYYGELTRQYGNGWDFAPIDPREVRRMVFESLKPVSNAPQLSPHALRHTFASELINNGMSMEAISKLLGHTHLETTEIYARMSNATAKQQYRQFHPAAA